MKFDMSGTKFKGTMSGEALANVLLPHLISALSTNPALRNAIVNAIKPSLMAAAQQTAATVARNTSPTRKP